MDLEFLNGQLQGETNRRQMLKRLGWGAAGIAGLNLLASTARAEGDDAPEDNNINVRVLQFALNLEYLEAEYYTYATTGHGIQASGIPINGEGQLGPTLVKPHPKVPFANDDVRQFALEIAHERANPRAFHSRDAPGPRGNAGSQTDDRLK